MCVAFSLNVVTLTLLQPSTRHELHINDAGRLGSSAVIKRSVRELMIMEVLQSSERDLYLNCSGQDNESRRWSLVDGHYWQLPTIRSCRIDRITKV